MRAMIGSGLQQSGFVSLSASNHGGASVTVTSPDPTRLLVSQFPDSAGAASFTRVLADGQTGFSYYAQALDNAVSAAIADPA